MEPVGAFPGAGAPASQPQVKRFDPPNRPRMVRRPTGPPPPRRTTNPAEHSAPRPNAYGTALLLAALGITWLNLGGQTPVAVARAGAVGVGIGLALSVLCDLRAGLRNLVRADLLALLALYFLTLFEFLFQQPSFDSMTRAGTTRVAVTAVLLGFAGLSLGRHALNLRSHPLTEIFVRPIPGAWLVALFWACFFVGFLHMLIAVRFNIFAMIEYFMAPRFSQPWQRGRLGDWKALLNELSLLLYLVPPIAGILLARRSRFNKAQVVTCVLGLAFLLFYGFTSGTRNLFISHLVTFIIAYAFAVDAARRMELILLIAGGAVLLLVSTVFMLRFRDIGLTNYIEGNYFSMESAEETLFVDFNLYAICRLVETFPEKVPFLGLEIPYLALVRPIPRAIWPGKPEGLSATIEDALGVEGLTIAASFIGEAYMAGGMIAIVVIATGLGMLAGWWGHFASPKNSELGILIYSSGFFAAVITMRSLFVFTTAILPTVAALAIGSFLVKRIRAAARDRDFARALAAEPRLPRSVRRPNPKHLQPRPQGPNTERSKGAPPLP